jgi:hypothetical protein
MKNGSSWNQRAVESFFDTVLPDDTPSPASSHTTTFTLFGEARYEPE